jgi:hypothetical protein
VAIYGSENGLVAYQFHEYEPSDVIWMWILTRWQIRVWTLQVSYEECLCFARTSFEDRIDLLTILPKHENQERKPLARKLFYTPCIKVSSQIKKNSLNPIW